MHVLTRADVSPAPSVVFGRGRGRGRDHDFGGRGSFGGGCGCYGGRQSDFNKGPDNMSIAGGIIISLRSAGRSLIARNGHSWLILSYLWWCYSCSFIYFLWFFWLFHCGESQDEYDRLCQLEFS